MFCYNLMFLSHYFCVFFFFKQKTAYEMRISDWSSDVCSSDLERQHPYSPWARRAQLMSAFSYYMDREYTPAIEAAQRFLAIHPGNKDAPYAYYLIGIS